MFNQLPKNVQKEVLKRLKTDDFIAAKAIHDAWIAKNQKTSNRATNPFQPQK